MPIHVAILKPHYARLIVQGFKTVESRLYRTSIPPIGCAEVGERVYLKQSGGPFTAVARIAAVDEYRELTPPRVRELAARYNDAVCGGEAYWESKNDSRFASFITLCEVEPIDVGPRYTASMRAWHTLNDTADVVWDYPLTDGAIRNRYACWPHSHSNGKAIELHLPGGEKIQTDLARGRMLRWRGWGSYYEKHRLTPGDRVRFVTLGSRRYRVSFHRS